MLGMMHDALTTSKADYTEIRLEEREATKVVFRGQDLETADMVVDRGGIVRALCHEDHIIKDHLCIGNNGGG